MGIEITKAKQIILHIWRGEIDKAIEKIMDETTQKAKDASAEKHIAKMAWEHTLLEERIDDMAVTVKEQKEKLEEFDKFRAFMIRSLQEAAMEKVKEDNEKKKESGKALAQEKEKAGEGEKGSEGDNEPKEVSERCENAAKTAKSEGERCQEAAGAEEKAKKKPHKRAAGLQISRVCASCGKKFKAGSGAARYCPECKAEGKTTPKSIADAAKELAEME